MILGIVELLATPLNQLQEGLDLSKYVQQMKGLTLAQAEAKLATEDLTDAQRRQILTSLGLVSSNDEFIISSKILTAEKLKEALASGVVSEADLEQAVSLGILTKSKDGDYIATKKLTVAELERQLVAAGMDPIIAKNIASLYADTGAKKANAGATGLLTKATIALNAAFAAHPYAMILGIIGAIAGITAAIIAYKNSVNGMIKSNQKLIESNKEAYNSLVDESKEYSNKADSLKSTYDDYLTATKGSEEYYEAVNKIAELSPDLVVGYDNEGNAIIANNEKIKEQIEYYKELAKAKQEAARQEAIENIGEETDSYQDLTGKKKSIDEKYKKQKELIDEYEAIIQKESEVGYDNLSTAEQRLYTNAVNMLSVEKDKLDEYKSDLEDLSNQIKAATDQLRTYYTSLLPVEDELTDAQKAIREGLLNTAIEAGMSSADFEEAYSNLNSEAVQKAAEEIINLDENLTDAEYRKQALAIYEKLANAFELTDEQKQAFKVAFKIDDETIQNAKETRDNNLEAISNKINDVSLSNSVSEEIKDWVNSLSDDDLQIVASLTFDKDSTVESLKEALEAAKGQTGEDTITIDYFDDFDGTPISERLDYLSEKFKKGEISHKEYFDSLQNEINNVDFSNYTNSAEDASNAMGKLFAASTAEAADGLDDLITKFDEGTIGVTEYLDGYLSIADTLSALTDSLQENSAAWNENGEAISDSQNQALDATQNSLSNAMSTIQSYQDSIYSLEQMMTGAVTAGTDEFKAHTEVIAEDLAAIVQNGGAMASEIANTLGTTTSEIANNLTQNVSNQSLAAQAIAANTNTAISDMATAVGELFNVLGEQISNFKAEINFGVDNIDYKELNILGHTLKIPWNVHFQLTASSSSLSAIGNAVKSFGQYLSSNISAQQIDLTDFTKTSDSSAYTPGKNVTGNYDNKLNNGSGGSGGGGGGSGSGSEQEDTYEEQMDFFEERIKKLDNAFDLLKTNLDNVWGSAAKIKLINAQYDLLEEKTKNTTDALAMYEEKAAEALGKIPADLRDRVVNGAVNITDFIGQGNEETVNAIKDYQEWADKVDDVKASLAELKQEMRELELDKFNAIVEEFTEKFDIRDTGIDTISKYIDLLEEQGAVVGASLYEEQKEQAKKQLEDLQKEKAALVKQLNESVSSGRLDVGSDEWLEAAKQLQELEGNILDCKKSIEEFDNAIQELHWKNLERIEDRFAAIASELENLIGLLEDQDVALEDGTWTEEGITQLGLVAQQYEKAAYEVEMYQKEIDALNEAYLRGEYSTDEYIEKLGDLKDAQWDAVNNMEDAKDAIIDIYEQRVEIMTEAIEKEIDAHQEATDAKIKELEAEKDLADYREQLLDKQKSVTDLERQIAAMSGDTTAATVAKRKKLEEQLSEARKDLDNFNRDHSIDTQKEALEQQQEDFEEQKNAEIEALEETLKEEELLISEAFELVKGNSETISKEIEAIARKYGIQISTDVTDPWKNGENAIASYSEVLSAQSSGFIAILEDVEDEIYNMQKKADEANEAVSDIFGDKSDALVNDLNEAYASAENLKNVAQAVKDSFVQAFDGSGYNFDSLINKLNQVKDAANAASAAAGSVGGGGGTSSGSSSSNTTYSDTHNPKSYSVIVYYKASNGAKISRTYNGYTTREKAETAAARYKGAYIISNGTRYDYITSNIITHYAKGVKNLKKDELAWTQDPNGTSKTREMIISPSSGAVLTPLKKGDSVLKNKFTENVFDMAEDPEGFILSKLKNSMFNFDNMPNTSAINQSNYQPITISMGDLIKINTMQNGDPEAMKKIANEAVNKLVNDINRQTRHSGGYR